MTKPARDKLAVLGYDGENGARPLARVIQEFIKKPLADELLFGRLAKGGRVTVSVVDNDFTFDFAESPPPKKKTRKKTRKKTKKRDKSKTDEPDALEPVK